MTKPDIKEKDQEAPQPPLKVIVKQLDHAQDLPLPSYATEGSAGMDLLAAIDKPIVMMSLERVLVPTGLQIALPIGFEAQIRPRSGLALKNGLSIPNSPGTIDADYRGEIAVILMNLGQEPYKITRGTRIAQMVIAPVVQAHWQAVDILPQTVRGSGGFGHTGS